MADVQPNSWGADPVMSDLETMMWRAEAEPRLRSTGIFVDRLDRSPEWERVLAAHEWATQLVPRLRQRVREDSSPLATPTWELDPGFDLAYHLRHVHVPEPAGLDEVLAIAQAMAMTPLDRARPLWEATLVEGLADGTAAYLLKLHHCLTDGQAGVQLFDLLHSATPESTPDKPTFSPEPERPAGSLTRSLSVVGSTVAGTALATGRLGVGFVRRPAPTIASSVGFVRSLARVTGPPPAAPSPLMRRRGLSRRFGVIDIPLLSLR
ncbi:MAG: diacylglycerol O-acyltransferase / wax synthase, partial [Solirubrobacteraceae bacterium]|nr:diacylglycerol O-acyltransferase / wax synthase [Solirubrobacteraceae bacterium]